mmetsp:Transcript_29164/g.58609  ORF Transcript_29164/g.58609 Transcript_29164/m.58609 type:complete len:260 (+) Transcript_29164:146-925(+)
MITPEETCSEWERRALRRKRAENIHRDACQREILVDGATSNRLLLNAVDRGHEEDVHKLLSSGCQLNYIGHRGVSSIHVAGNPSIARLLLKTGANPNLPTCAKASAETFGGGTFSMGGNTALAYGAFTGHTEVIRVLLEQKADVRIPNENEDLPVDVAKIQMHQKVVRMLGDPDEAVSKARRERKEALTVAAAEREAKDRSAVKIKRRKESRHRRAVEQETRRFMNEKEREEEEIRGKSKIMIPVDQAQRLDALAHYPT